jgi:hypothetical protein
MELNPALAPSSIPFSLSLSLSLSRKTRVCGVWGSMAAGLLKPVWWWLGILGVFLKEGAKALLLLNSLQI